MEERDEHAFEQMLNEIIYHLKSNSDTAEFGEYFCKKYQQTARYWAYCYRQHAGLNTNMQRKINFKNFCDKATPHFFITIRYERNN